MIILFHFRSEREFHADTLCRKHFVSALESVRQILLTEERESESESDSESESESDSESESHFHINIVFPFCQTFRRKTLKLS